MISNYGQLKTYIQSYLNYNDNSVTSSIPLFISMANQELNRVLRTPAQEQHIYHTVALDDETTLPVPNNLIELRRIYYGDTFETIDRVDIETLPREKYNYSDISSDNRPVSFARSHDYFILSRTAIVGTEIHIVYYQEVTDMTDDNDVNTFLEIAPLALLYRAIAEGHRFLENISMADYWFAKASEEVTMIQRQATLDENAGSVLAQCNQNWY